MLVQRFFSVEKAGMLLCGKILVQKTHHDIYESQSMTTFKFEANCFIGSNIVYNSL